MKQDTPPAGVSLSFFTNEERNLLSRYRDERQLSEADRALLTKIGSAVVRLNVDSASRMAGGEHRRLVAGDPSALPGHDAITRLKKIEPLGTKYRVLCGRCHPCPAEIALAISSYFEAIDEYDPRRETPHSGAEDMETSAYNLSRDAEWRLVAPSIFDGHKKRKGSKLHAAVETLGHLLAARVTRANEQERAQVAALAEAVQEVTGNTVEVAFVDQGDTGDHPAEAAAEHGIDLVVVSLPEAKRGFVLLPRRWVVERSFAWATHFRRLAKDDERLPETIVGLHFVAFACLMLHRALSLLAASP
jgi:transposase